MLVTSKNTVDHIKPSPTIQTKNTHIQHANHKASQSRVFTHLEEKMKQQLCKPKFILASLCLSYALVQIMLFHLSHELMKDALLDAIDVDSSPPQLINLEEEIKKSEQYIQSITDTKRKLIFVHIPKNAGTTIEDMGAAQARQSWGSCLFNHKPKRKVCKSPVMLYPKEFLWPMKVGYWHLPPHLFPLMGTDPYKDADLFAVVRDPRDRLLSEFYYICRKKMKPEYWDAVDCNRTRVHEPEYLNQWLQRELSSTPATSEQYNSAKHWLFRNGHFTPQYEFIVSPTQQRIVDYVLQMKNLDTELNGLMKAYNIKAKMPPLKHNVGRNDTRDLTFENMDEKTNGLIEEKFKRDFASFFNDQED